MNAHRHDLEYLPVSALNPYPGNAKQHSHRQVKKIARSMQRFGFLAPAIVNASNEVIAGHGRLLAAQQLGLSVIPVMRVAHLTEAEVRAYRLADNRLADDGKWDDDLLRVELSDLSAVDIEFDVELTGFETAEIDICLGVDQAPAVREIEPVEAPDPVLAITQPGDLWQLGPHRLICGDIRDPGVLHCLMQAKQARMMLTDPPYNVKVEGHVSGLGRSRHREFAFASGEMNSAEYTAFLHASLVNVATHSLDGALHYVFIDWRHLQELTAAAADVYSQQLNLCVWSKTNGGMGSLYRSQHELIAVWKVGRAPHVNNVELGRYGRYRTNVWPYAGMNSFSVGRDDTLALHPTVKPVQMLADAILDVTRRGDIVLDGFLGSGSTLLAAEQVGRVAYGVEIDPAYCDVAIDRWQRLTGEDAVLESSGQSFSEVATDRRIVPAGESAS